MSRKKEEFDPMPEFEEGEIKYWMKDLTEKVRKELNEFPSGYDAHKDQLSDSWDHEEAVNKLLALLREIIPEKKKL